MPSRQESYLERETGIEPATLCLGSLGLRNPPCPDRKSSISARLSPLLPTLGIRPQDSASARGAAIPLQQLFELLAWNRLAEQEALHLVTALLVEPGLVLKPNMVIAGSDCSRQATSDEIAELTLVTLREFVPAEVPGIAFLSGGQTGEEACTNLDAMARRGDLPWELTYSFGRALQYLGLEIWGGARAPPLGQRSCTARA